MFSLLVLKCFISRNLCLPCSDKCWERSRALCSQAAPSSVLLMAPSLACLEKMILTMHHEDGWTYLIGFGARGEPFFLPTPAPVPQEGKNSALPLLPMSGQSSVWFCWLLQATATGEGRNGRSREGDFCRTSSPLGCSGLPRTVAQFFLSSRHLILLFPLDIP